MSRLFHAQGFILHSTPDTASLCPVSFSQSLGSSPLPMFPLFLPTPATHCRHCPPTHPQPYTPQSLFILMCLPLSRMVRGSRGPLQPPFAICLGCWDSAQQSRGAGGRGGGAGRVSSKAAELSCWLSCLCQLPCPPPLLASPPQGCQGSRHFWTEEFRSQLSVVWCRPPSPREAGCWAREGTQPHPPAPVGPTLCSLRASEQMREHCPLESLLRHFASCAGGNVREHVARAGRIPGSRRGQGGAGCGYFPRG